MTAGKKFKNNIELGFKYRYSGGSPYTPIDIINSSNKIIWDINQQAVLDYNLLNTKRLNGSHVLDIRIDKKWFFKSWGLNAYIDIENILNSKTELPSQYGIDSNLGTIVEGTGVITLDGQEKEYTKGETVLIPQGVKHRIENKGQEKVVFIEVQTGTYLEKMI